MSASASSHINWQYFDTAHFRVIYHPEVTAQAKEVGATAEQVFLDNAAFTGFQPLRRIAIIVSGLEDFSNGYSIPADIIKVWVNPLNTSTRVDQDWLKNLITHELSHTLQMEATFGLTYWLQKLTGVSTALALPPNTIHPTWFLEGAAQYGSYRQGFDSLDRKRTMVMEQRIQSDKFFTPAELYWGRGNISGEAWYNFGFGFFEFLMSHYGEDKFLELQKYHNTHYWMGLDASIRAVYKVKLPALIEEWKVELRQKFPLRTDRASAEAISEKPEFSEWHNVLKRPDGSVIFAENNPDRISSVIKLWTPEKGLVTLLDNPNLYFTHLDLSPDGNKVLYTAYQVQNQLVHYDLFELDITTKKTRRLTKDQRVLMARYFREGYLVLRNDYGKTHLYYLSNENLAHKNSHTGQIANANLTNSKMQQLTNTDYNMSITDFVISPDSTQVAVNFNYNGQRGIGLLSGDSWHFSKVYYPSQGLDWILGDFRDSSTLTVSWDRLNHYDLYTLNIKTDTLERVTNTREDILHGVIFSEKGQEYWLGQIYGTDGFTVAKGPVTPGESLQIAPGSISFEPAPIAQVEILKEGTYSHFGQLRQDVILPYIDGEDKITRLGLVQLLTDPLRELQVISNTGWDFMINRPIFDLTTSWTGNNPALNFNLGYDGQTLHSELMGTLDFSPYSVSLGGIMNYDSDFTFDRGTLQINRSWDGARPGLTNVDFIYSPDDGFLNPSIALEAKHTFTIPVGYRSDMLTSSTSAGLAAGRFGLSWAQDGPLWAYSDERLAQQWVLQELNYHHNLIDLSKNFSNVVQTGRLYADVFAKAGMFSIDTELVPAAMVGVGLELETKMLNLYQTNYQVRAAINPAGEWKITYGVAAPF